jgi:DNA helicase TIP49 (TBP-interacting protein)
VALEMFRTRIWQAGQVVALCGPVGAGKTLLRLIITEMLGGRVAFPHSFMTGRTAFSGDLFGAETLAIEDQQESIDIRARRHFGAAIKDLAVNRDQRCERKHCDALTLVPLRRVIVTMNDDAERIQVLLRSMTSQTNHVI